MVDGSWFMVGGRPRVTIHHPPLTISVLCLALLLASSASWAAAVAVLPDDDATRGNWHPVYGQRSYVFFALGENRAAVTRGDPLLTRVYTGRPDREPQVWRSRGDWELDGRVLRNPLTGRRMPGVINDWVSDAKLGRGPNLFLDVSIPDGLFVLSLYFFEVDWIQYRAYTLTVQAPDGKVLATTPVEDFYEGKYKRLAVSGPTKLTLHLRRQMSTNALVSAAFLDPVAPSLPFVVAFYKNEWRFAAGATWSCPQPSFLAARRRYEELEALLAKTPDVFVTRVNQYSEVAGNLDKFMASAELPSEHRLEALWMQAQSRRQLGDMAGKRRALTDFAQLLAKSNPSRATTAEILDAAAQKCLGAGQTVEAQALHDGLVATMAGDATDVCLKLATLYAGKDDLYAAGKAGAAARALATNKALPEAERADRAIKLARRFLGDGKPLLA
ncbi:MAG: hypothetical protein FJ279_04815, partial [Planctomycetes bacterium]|nr:hypothetical protein [Planctomycetota bacterium]